MEAEGKVGTWKELSPLSAPPSLVGQGRGGGKTWQEGCEEVIPTPQSRILTTLTWRRSMIFCAMVPVRSRNLDAEPQHDSAPLVRVELSGLPSRSGAELSGRRQ